MDNLSDAFNVWGTAFNAAARARATAGDTAAYGKAATKLKASLANATKALESAPSPGCAAEARAKAAAFLDVLQQGLDPLLLKDSISLGDLATAGALLEAASRQAPDVATAIRAACL